MHFSTGSPISSETSWSLILFQLKFQKLLKLTKFIENCNNLRKKNLSISSSRIIYNTDSSPPVYPTPLSGCMSVNHAVWQIPGVGARWGLMFTSHTWIFSTYRFTWVNNVRSSDAPHSALLHNFTPPPLPPLPSIYIHKYYMNLLWWNYTYTTHPPSSDCRVFFYSLSYAPHTHTHTQTPFSWPIQEQFNFQGATKCVCLGGGYAPALLWPLIAPFLFFLTPHNWVEINKPF